MLDRPVPGDLPPGVLFDRRHPAPPRMWWRTAAFVSVALAGLWVPLQRSLDDIDSQSPLALVGWALPLAVAVALHGIRSEPDPTEARPQRSADGFIAACAFAVGLLCAFAAPAAFGWETAAARPELLAAPGLLAGWIVVFFGSRALWLARRGIALAVAACPVWYGWLVPPLQRLGIEVAWPPVVAVGKLLGVTTTDAAGLHAAGFGDGTMVVLGATCAGASTVLGVGLVLTAAASVLRGSTAAKVRWVLAGSAAALLANAIRLAVLVMVGALVSPAAALQVVHPVAGVVMALATTAVALGTSRRFGLAVPVTPRRRIDDRLAGCAPRRITAAAAVAVVVAAGANVAYASMWQLDRLGGASADDNDDADDDRHGRRRSGPRRSRGRAGVVGAAVLRAEHVASPRALRRRRSAARDDRRHHGQRRRVDRAARPRHVTASTARGRTRDRDRRHGRSAGGAFRADEGGARTEVLMADPCARWCATSR
ncbi:MAG: archaeosortase/exosortase family protein [Ilumatobacteraceae bacterium]